MVDLSKAKVGDFIHARIEVTRVDLSDPYLPIEATINGVEQWFRPEEIVGIESTLLKVGDSAITPAGNRVKIVHLSKDSAAVEFVDGTLSVIAATHLERA